jgi:DNA-binding transcriptional ArsR family regulator
VRLRIVTVLARGGRCVCNLHEQVPEAANLLSYHLRVLRDAGLVTATGRGRHLPRSCARHRRWLTRTMVINCVVIVEPPARTIRCGVYQAARDTAGPYASVQASGAW